MRPVLLAFALAVPAVVAGCPAPAASGGVSAVAPFVDRTLTTSAEAEVLVVPDQAMMSFVIDTEDNTLESATKKTDGPVARALAALKGLDVKPEHMQTTVAQGEQKLVYDAKGNARVVGFTATRSVTVRIVDLEKLDAIAGAVTKGGGIRVAQVVYEDSKLTEHKELARVKAAEAARAKAETLASKLGAMLGPPRLVTEQGAPSLLGLENWRNSAYNSIVDLADGNAVAGETFAPGRVTVSASVHVVFDLIAS